MHISERLLIRVVPVPETHRPSQPRPIADQCLEKQVQQPGTGRELTVIRVVCRCVEIEYAVMLQTDAKGYRLITDKKYKRAEQAAVRQRPKFTNPPVVPCDYVVTHFPLPGPGDNRFNNRQEPGRVVGLGVLPEMGLGAVCLP